MSTTDAVFAVMLAETMVPVGDCAASIAGITMAAGIMERDVSLMIGQYVAGRRRSQQGKPLPNI
jgi:hypothetical protein